jgi:hypothetical protein
MELPKTLKKLCTPALVYFFISIFGVLLLFFQNIGNNKKYSIGSYSAVVPSTILMFILKLVYILFWTWILNLLCKNGFTGLSWLFVLFPIILMFVILGLVVLNKM